MAPEASMADGEHFTKARTHRLSDNGDTACRPCAGGLAAR